MSANWIYDCIEDQVIQALEKEAPLPEAFDIALPRDQYDHLIKLGLLSEGKPVPADATSLLIQVMGYDVLVSPEDGENK